MNIRGRLERLHAAHPTPQRCDHGPTAIVVGKDTPLPANPHACRRCGGVRVLRITRTVVTAKNGEKP